MRQSVLALALLTACKHKAGDGAYGALPDADVTIVDPGSGPENQQPLEPALAGAHTAAAGDRAAYDWNRWDGALDAGKDELVTADMLGTGLVGLYEQSVQVYRATDDGLVLHAWDYPLDPVLPPVLMVPTTVRLGMTWDSTLYDGSTIRMKVTDHETVNLAVGPADVWAITNTLDDVDQTTRWYAEGIGLVAESIDPPTWPPSTASNEILTPIDEQPHSEPALDPADLTGVLALNDAFFDVWHLSGQVVDGVLWAYVDGNDEANGYTRAEPRDLCAELDDTPTMVDLGGVTRPVAAACADYDDDYPDEFGDGYTIIKQVYSANQILPGSTMRLDLDGGGAVSSDTLAGWVVDGVPHTLTFGQDDDPPQLFSEVAWDSDDPVPTALDDGVLMRAMFTSGDASPTGQVWIAPARAEPGQTLYLAMIDREGRVFRVTLDDSGLHGFLPAGVMPGAVSVLLDDDERVAFSITKDGRVFRLDVDADNGDVTVGGLGAVRVDTVGGAYDFMGVLVDPTHPGDVWVAATAYATTASDPAYASGLFRGHLDGEAEPVVTAPALNVGMADVDAGMAVCWAPTSEAFDGNGWTLHGDAAHVVGPVGPDGNCAIVDDSAPVDGAWLGSERALQANIPGVGAVRLGYPAGRQPAQSLDPIAARLPDGSIVDATGQLLDPYGLPLSRASTHLSSRSVATGWSRDVGGYGLWAWYTGTQVTTTLQNLGGGIATPPCPSSEPWTSCTYYGQVVGGGVLYLSPDPAPGLQVIRPDGSADDVPAAQYAVVRTRGAPILVADGRICGVTSRRVDCVDAAGVSVTAGTVSGNVGADPWWPLPDGSLMLTTDAGTWRLDLDAMSLDVLDVRAIHAPITATDGRVYAIALDLASGGTYSVVQVTAAGATDLAVATGTSVVLPIDGALLVYDLDGATSPWTRLAR